MVYKETDEDKRDFLRILFALPFAVVGMGAAGHALLSLAASRISTYPPTEQKKDEKGVVATQPQFIGESYLETQNLALDVNGRKEGVSYSTLMKHLQPWGEGAITVYGREQKPTILDFMNDSVNFGSGNWEEAYKNVAKLSNPSAIQTHHQTAMEGHEEGLFVYDMDDPAKPVFTSELIVKKQ